MQTMFHDCRKIFAVPSFVIILVAEIIMVIGGSGAGYQIMYFEVGYSGMVSHNCKGLHAGILFSEDMLVLRTAMLRCAKGFRSASYVTSSWATLA